MRRKDSLWIMVFGEYLKVDGYYSVEFMMRLGISFLGQSRVSVELPQSALKTFDISHDAKFLSSIEGLMQDYRAINSQY